MKLDKDAFE
jgi:hypothetical protein